VQMMFIRMPRGPLYAFYYCVFDKNGFSDLRHVAGLRIKIMQSLFDALYQALLLQIECIMAVSLFFQN